MPNFGRKIDITIGASNYSGLYVDFTVIKSDDSSLNTANIIIYNLSETSRTNIKKGDILLLNAGYQDNIGNIYAGTISEVGSNNANSDWVTNIICKDGIDIAKIKISKSYAPGTTSDTVINDLARLTGLEIGQVKLGKTIIYSNGKVIFGLLLNELIQVVKESGSIFTITGNKISILPPNEPGKNLVTLISKGTGLLQTPAKLEEISEGKELYTVKCQLNPTYNVGGQVQIQSKSLNGLVKIKTVIFEGSLDGNNFDAELEVIVSE